jgi:hypothetical protein
MAGTILGAIAGAFLGWFIIAVMTDGPKYPGDTSYEGGPGCLVLLVVVSLLAAIGAVVGTFLG